MTENNTTPTPPGGGLMNKIVAATAIITLPVASVWAYLMTRTASNAANSTMERGMRYDMEALQKVDPKLITWREVGRMDTQVRSARAIAVDRAGDVLVGGEGLVRRMSPAGKAPGDLTVSADVQAIAVGVDGMIYVGTKTRVERFAADGKMLGTLIDLGAEAHITSIAAGADSLYIGDFGHRVVHRTDLAGKVLGVIGKEDKKRHIAGLNLPSPHMDVAVAADGSLWVANTGQWRLENYSPDGEFNRFWGESGSAIEQFVGCCNPADFWLMHDGSFITAEKGVARVKHYSPDGKFLGVVAAASSFPANMVGLDVTADASGRVLVLPRGTSSVIIFAPAEGK